MKSTKIFKKELVFLFCSFVYYYFLYLSLSILPDTVTDCCSCLPKSQCDHLLLGSVSGCQCGGGDLLGSVSGCLQGTCYVAQCQSPPFPYLQEEKVYLNGHLIL